MMWMPTQAITPESTERFSFQKRGIENLGGNFDISGDSSLLWAYNRNIDSHSVHLWWEFGGL